MTRSLSSKMTELWRYDRFNYHLAGYLFTGYLFTGKLNKGL